MIVGSYDDVIADRSVQRRIINEEPVCEPKVPNSVACFHRCFANFRIFGELRPGRCKVQGEGLG